MSSVLALVLMVPAVILAGLGLPRFRRIAVVAAPWAAAPALVAACVLPDQTGIAAPWLFLGATWTLDAVARPFLALSATVWLAAGIYASGYLRCGAASPVSPTSPGGSIAAVEPVIRYFRWYLAAMLGNLALIPAQDPVTYLVFFALMSFAAYGLIVFQRTPAALAAGRVYIIMTIIGETAAFSGLVWACFTAQGNLTFPEIARVLATGEHRDVILALLFVGFGIKLGVMPLHLWLPLAHPAAPTPASAVLSGVMLKTGLLLWLRLFPEGGAGIMTPWTGFLLGIGLTTTFLAALIGLTQTNPKAVLAYSSISQMGLAAVGVGLLVGHASGEASPLLGELGKTGFSGGLGVPEVPGSPGDSVISGALQVLGGSGGAQILALFAFHHALAKGALFLGVGLAAAHLSRRRRQLLNLGLAISGAALAGFPLTSGHVAKGALKALAQGLTSPWHEGLAWALPLSGCTTMLLLIRYWLMVAPVPAHPHGEGCNRMFLPWAALTVGVVSFPWIAIGVGWIDPVQTGWTLAGALKALLPPAAAMLIALAWLHAFSRSPMLTRWRSTLAAIVIPAGDIVVPIEACLLWSLGVLRAWLVEPIMSAREHVHALANRLWRYEGTLLITCAQQETFALGMILMAALALGVALLL